MNFQKVFTINLLHRTDRKDIQEHVLGIAGIDSTFFPAAGVDDPELLALAESQGKRHISGARACWMSHFRVWKTIVEQDITTALILEDDVDMEVNIREIAGERLASLKENGNDDKWDIMYLGFCGGPKEADVVHQPLGKGIYLSHFGNVSTACTHGYAVTKRGAEILSTYLDEAVTPVRRPVDLAMGRLAIDGKIRSAVWQHMPIIQLPYSSKYGSDVSHANRTKISIRGRVMRSAFEEAAKEKPELLNYFF